MGASYRAAVKWIAENDEPSETDIEKIATKQTVYMASALFDTSSREIAADVRDARAGKKAKCDLVKGCTLRKGHKSGCVDELGETLPPPATEAAQ